jgi:hypothetical protein
MPRVTATIPAELEAALERRAQVEDRSESAVVRRALLEHLQPSPLPQVVAAPDGPHLETSSLGVAQGSNDEGGGSR